MKNLLLLLVLLFFTGTGRAQNLSEWTRQNRTQKRYLETQIAELKIYLELAKKGYTIAKEGLATIHGLKNGEFKLHKNHFDSLLIVGPVAAGSPRAKDITDLHGHINQICQDGPALLAQSGQLTQRELSYIRELYSQIYKECQGILINLLSVIRNGNLAMDDAQRLERIQVLYGQMLSSFRFVRSFQSQAMLLNVQRSRETNQIQTGRALHGLD